MEVECKEIPMPCGLRTDMVSGVYGRIILNRLVIDTVDSDYILQRSARPVLIAARTCVPRVDLEQIECFEPPATRHLIRPDLTPIN